MLWTVLNKTIGFKDNFLNPGTYFEVHKASEEGIIIESNGILLIYVCIAEIKIVWIEI